MSEWPLLKFPNILGHFTLRVTTRFRNFQFSSSQIANHFWPDNLQPEEKRNWGVNLCHPFTGSNNPICLINEPGAQEYFGAEGWRKYIGVCYWYQVETKHHPRYWSKASQSQIYSNFSRLRWQSPQISPEFLAKRASFLNPTFPCVYLWKKCRWNTGDFRLVSPQVPPQPLPWKDATDVGRGKSKTPRLAPLTTAAALTGLAAGAATGAATLAVCVPVLGGKSIQILGWFQETMAPWGTIDAKTERDTKIY